MATYYVSPSGSNTSPYDTWAKASTTIQTAVAAATGAGDVVEIDGGASGQNYAENISGVAAVGTTIMGSVESGKDGQVTVTGQAGDEAIDWANVAHSDYTIKRINFVGNGTQACWAQSSSSPNIVFEDCEFEGKGVVHYVLATGTSFTRCKFKGLGNTSTSGSISVEGNITCDFDGCEWVADANFYSNKVRIRASADVTINRCSFDGLYSSAAHIQNDATSTLTFTNCVVGTWNLNNGNSSVLDNSAGGTLTENNNFFAPPAYDAQHGYGITPDATDVTDAAPAFTTSGYNKGYLCVSVDDGEADGGGASQYAFAASIAAVCAARGAYMTWYIDWLRFASYHTTGAARTAILTEFTDAGHEIGLHGYSNSLWSATKGFTATGAGTTPTIDVDVATDTITCNDVENGNQTVTGYAAKSMGTIIAEIQAFTDWSCVIGDDGINTSALGSSLADTAGGQAAGAGYICLLDRTGYADGYFYDELTNTKTLLEAAIGGGYTVKAARPVGFSDDADSRLALRDAGIYGNSSDTTAAGGRNLADFDIYNSNGVTSSHQSFSGASTEADWNKAGVSIAQQCVSMGGMWNLLTHVSTEISAEQIGWILDGAATVPGLTFITAGDLYEDIQTSGNWTDTGSQLNWTRTFSDASDMNLESDSTALGIGVKDWGNAARPHGRNGEPYPDSSIDVGANQSTHNTRHPNKL